MTADDFVRIDLTPENKIHIQWLLDNYETADGTSLPRCTLYDHYKKHCGEHKLDAVNAASFGKLIRSVFLGLRTRRLGTRGNSKYHYYGIRIKADSPLLQGHIPERYSPTESATPTARPSLKRPATAMTSQNSRPASSSPAPRYSPNGPAVSASNGQPRSDATDADRASLGDGEVPILQTPQTDGLIEALPKLGLEVAHVVMFVNSYNHNCSEVLYCIKQLQFEQVEEYWTAFWQPEEDLDEEELVPSSLNIKPSCIHMKNLTFFSFALYIYVFCSKSLSGQARLTQQQLFSLCTLPQIQQWVVSLDLAFYQMLVDVLVPDVLMSQMSGWYLCSPNHNILM
uniref:RFX-type winged-helix domain-containing protein n=1 Tax=Heterorhabditis bacteriophora TaxID=37862 RepID=A0A1I7XP81_HETBA